ncbi:MAG: hypothetical protein JW828_01345 [Sedimentisphaerales bacterium]|nr:hypothetical protein [Sedimentisphaerales bacterium]
MKPSVNLFLLLPDVHQILDLVKERYESWHATTIYLETDDPPQTMTVEPCFNEQEARAMTEYYQYLVQSIERQLEVISFQIEA